MLAITIHSTKLRILAICVPAKLCSIQNAHEKHYSYSLSILGISNWLHYTASTMVASNYFCWIQNAVLLRWGFHCNKPAVKVRHRMTQRNATLINRSSSNLCLQWEQLRGFLNAGGYPNCPFHCCTTKNKPKMLHLNPLQKTKKI